MMWTFFLTRDMVNTWSFLFYRFKNKSQYACLFIHINWFDFNWAM